eukprot:m.47769 g.47769  ORF g.47769 m.47769 type:complete len:68 (+) comp6926_c0_seq1:192-395(+)
MICDRWVGLEDVPNRLASFIANVIVMMSEIHVIQVHRPLSTWHESARACPPQCQQPCRVQTASPWIV